MARGVPAWTRSIAGLHSVYGALDRRFGRLTSLRARRAGICAGHGDGSYWDERFAERLPGSGRTVAVLGGRNFKHSLAAAGSWFPGGGILVPARAGCDTVCLLLRGSLAPAGASRCPADSRRIGRRFVPAFERRAGVWESLLRQR